MTTGVVDTDGKLDAFINNTSGQLTAGVVDAGVVDLGLLSLSCTVAWFKDKV
jgi:hypothetical protein